MARTKDEAAHAAKRDQILDAVEALSARVGFESMTIADVLAETGMSKGAFYHYFAAKSDLLDGVIQRWGERWVPNLEAADNPSATFPERLRAVLTTAYGIKFGMRGVISGTVRSFYDPENLRFRVDRERLARQSLAPIVARILTDRPGTEDPRALAEVVVSLLYAWGDQLGERLIDLADGVTSADAVVSLSRAYQRSLGAVLGVGEDTFYLIDDTQLRQWAEAIASADHAPRTTT